MSDIAHDYLVLCYLSSLGVVQIAAVYGRLQGLFLLRWPLPSAVLGLLLVFGGFLWFFLPGPRLVSDTNGGLDGNQQALYFALCAGSAVVTTLLLSSLVNRRRLHARPTLVGLDALRHATYFQAIRRVGTELWKRSPKRIPRSFSGSTAG